MEKFLSLCRDSTKSMSGHKTDLALIKYKHPMFFGPTACSIEQLSHEKKMSEELRHFYKSNENCKLHKKNSLL